jgi:hypothetical protein
MEEWVVVSPDVSDEDSVPKARTVVVADSYRDFFHFCFSFGECRWFQQLRLVFNTLRTA